VVIRLGLNKAMTARQSDAPPCSTGEYGTAALNINNNSHSVIEASSSITAGSLSRAVANPLPEGEWGLLILSPARR